jgi:hypothetical protein
MSKYARHTIIKIIYELELTSVAARSKVYVCGSLVAGVAGLNPAEGMDVCLLCLYVVLCR